MTKLCILCVNCKFDEGWGGSKYTPGYNAFENGETPSTSRRVT